MGPVAQRPLVRVGAGQGEQAAEEARRGVLVGADHDVLEHGHPVEEADALQRAGDAEAGEVARAQAARPARRASDDVAGVGRTKPQATLNRVVLPAPLGPMTPVHLAGLDREGDVAEGGEPAEGDGDAAELEFGHERV